MCWLTLLLYVLMVNLRCLSCVDCRNMHHWCKNNLMIDVPNADILTVSLLIFFLFLSLACVQTITKLWLVLSAKQRRDPCSGPPIDSTNYRKCVSNFPSTWFAITSLGTNKTKVFFNWPIVVHTQIWVHSWKSRTRILALFRRRSEPEFNFVCTQAISHESVII